MKRLEGKPFALVGVNSDKNLEELHAAMAKEQITWPSWFDGGGTGGPIASLYGVIVLAHHLRPRPEGRHPVQGRPGRGTRQGGR